MLNAARRGLGTGRREDIAAVARQVTLVALESGHTTAAEKRVPPGHVVEATVAGRRRADQEPR
jgi:hypothetical protein